MSEYIIVSKDVSLFKYYIMYARANRNATMQWIQNSNVPHDRSGTYYAYTMCNVIKRWKCTRIK